MIMYNILCDWWFEWLVIEYVWYIYIRWYNLPARDFGVHVLDSSTLGMWI